MRMKWYNIYFWFKKPENKQVKEIKLDENKLEILCDNCKKPILGDSLMYHEKTNGFYCGDLCALRDSAIESKKVSYPDTYPLPKRDALIILRARNKN